MSLQPKFLGTMMSLPMHYAGACCRLNADISSNKGHKDNGTEEDLFRPKASVLCCATAIRAHDQQQAGRTHA